MERPDSTCAAAGGRVPQEVRQRLEDFLAGYCHQIDDGDIDSWPGFFAERCVYEITTRQNVDAGLPIGIMYCEGRGMLEDRIKAMKTANIFEQHVYCHLTGRPEIREEGPASYSLRSNFAIYRTMYTGAAELFATGKYLDTVSLAEGEPFFTRRKVVLDSRSLDTLLVIPF